MVIAIGPRRAFPFLNRVDERDEMRRLLARRRAEGRACLVFVHGPEGIGRTSLVSEFFHEQLSAFDGKCIVVEARRPDGRPVPQGELLSQILRGLGQAEKEQASSDAERLAAYQRCSAGRRFLLVVLDVVNAEQVINLNPVAAPEAAVVVTTRTMLRELLRHDFEEVPLSRLPRAESHDLLVTCLDKGAPKIPQATIAELAELCDGFPLLIRIVGSQLVRREHAAARYLADLRSSESALLERMAGFLDVTYELLETDVRRAYRRLSLLPGPSFDAAAAAVALEQPRAERLLDELVDANLLVFDQGSGRYSFYRIVRADARRRLLDADDPEIVQAAIKRITLWYLRESMPRDAALAARWRVGPEFERDFEPVSRAAATSWFEAEWTSVVACVRLAHDAGLHAIAWQLCVAVFKYLHIHGHVDAWLDSHQLGVSSARAAGDQLGIMQVTSQRGSAYRAIGDRSSARADFEASLAAALLADHRLGEQSAWEWQGKVAAEVDEAFRCYAESEAVIERSTEAEIPTGQRIRMLALLSLDRGRAWVVRQEWDQAHATGVAALRYFESSGEAENHAKCLLVLGDAALGRGDFPAAAGHFKQAAELFAGDGARRAEAGALCQVGAALTAAGDTAGAIEALRTARDLYLELGDATADIVTARLSEL